MCHHTKREKEENEKENNQRHVKRKQNITPVRKKVSRISEILGGDDVIEDDK